MLFSEAAKLIACKFNEHTQISDNLVQSLNFLNLTQNCFVGLTGSADDIPKKLRPYKDTIVNQRLFERQQVVNLIPEVAKAYENFENELTNDLAQLKKLTCFNVQNQSTDDQG